MACIKRSVRSGSSSVLLPFLVVFLYATLLSHHFLSASAAVAAAHGRHSRRNHASTQSRASAASGPGWYRSRAAVPFQPATRSSSRFAAAAASGPCSFVSCPKGCTCAASGGVAKCSCKDPCYGVKCPHVSKCAVQDGAVVCKCPAPFKRLINNRCSSDDYPNSDYLDPHNAARAAVGAVPIEWDDAVAERAQAWADTLRDDYNCGLEHGGMGEGEGQNLSGAGPAGWAWNSDAVQWWVGEGKSYNRISGDWGSCGHYSQVVWNDSRKVGCGKASCGGDGDVWACNYYPAGNFVGERPYGELKGAEDCLTGSSQVQRIALRGAHRCRGLPYGELTGAEDCLTGSSQVQRIALRGAHRASRDGPGTSLPNSDWLTNPSFSAMLLPAAEAARRAAVDTTAWRAAEGRIGGVEGEEGREGEDEGEEEEGEEEEEEEEVEEGEEEGEGDGDGSRKRRVKESSGSPEGGRGMGKLDDSDYSEGNGKDCEQSEKGMQSKEKEKERKEKRGKKSRHEKKRRKKRKAGKGGSFSDSSGSDSSRSGDSSESENEEERRERRKRRKTRKEEEKRRRKGNREV
ncbi:unnamed protein product [Closterium sp. NIES-53]